METLHDEIQLLRFVNETVFQTKSGSFGMALEVSGLDPECRLEVPPTVLAAALRITLRNGN
jgi:hypothetical protein